MKLGETLKSEKIKHVRPTPPLCVSRKTTAEKVISEMLGKKAGCAIILEGKKLIGIFTERDALRRIAAVGAPLSAPIEKYMTPDPKSLKATDSIATAIRLMNKGEYRRVPMIDEAGKVIGVLSVRNIVRYLAEHFPYEIYNLPPDPQQVQQSREGA